MNASQSSDLVSIGETLNCLYRMAAVASEERATVRVGSWLAQQVAISMNARFADVWDVMTHLPDGYLGLLHSPEGWSAISAIIAADLGVSSVPVVPAIH